MCFTLNIVASKTAFLTCVSMATTADPRRDGGRSGLCCLHRTSKILITEPPNSITAGAGRPNVSSPGRLAAHLAGMIVAGVWNGASIRHWARLDLQGGAPT